MGFQTRDQISPVFSERDSAAATSPRSGARRASGLAVLASLTAAVLVVAGCGPTAYKITPVPVDRTLDETTIIHEGGWAPPKIVLIDIDGIIMNREKFELLGEGENPVSLFAEKLNKAAKDPSVKGVVLRINSPGGGVTASDLMYNELQVFKQRTEGKRPVVAVLMDVAASGGYYVACGADEIVAHPTTITGSIGVIMQLFSLSGTMNKLGADATAITSGPMKDAGSPFKKLRPEERAIFQSIVDDFYARFVAVVVRGRPNLTEEKVREIADGRIYSAQQALELGLVDRIGSLRDALASVKEKIGADRVRVVMYHRPLGWKPNVYAENPAGTPQVNMVNIQLPRDMVLPEAQFLYLWAPGL
ncbi:MAG TPA: signal peptide peptidase SppA [Phycisphaerae bacterium]|nr:signal peptide peptidase SppA [Phycisphaerae bacterium]HOJ74205.1 signal peptide peptidase SppA [Phycisphaerae bacterium]HOM51283.1 signal peptide peptidase SppA [Phycisphaerae bacterium]HPP26752.1 signal peptide peptidase SppA [Phycisphaerae bacterium]HPZ98444.1 signal peptide peptidase SppA [Phycisphaerae bacterium]